MEVSRLHHDPSALLTGNKPVPVEYEVGSTESWSEHFHKEKNLLPLPGFKHRFIQSIAYSLYHIDIQLKLKLYVNSNQSIRLLLSVAILATILQEHPALDKNSRPRQQTLHSQGTYKNTATLSKTNIIISAVLHVTK
jgi:hypothetical protein